MYKYTFGREQDASSPTEFSSLFSTSSVMLDWAQQFLYHILVAYSVFFVLRINQIPDGGL